MPIYEYHCGSCGANFDAIQKFSDAPLTECRECGAAGVRKLLSAPSFRLKGGGWYETDFKKDKQRNVVKKEGDGAASGSSDGGSGSGNDAGSKADAGSSKTGDSSKSSDSAKSSSSGSGSSSAA